MGELSRKKIIIQLFGCITYQCQEKQECLLCVKMSTNGTQWVLISIIMSYIAFLKEVSEEHESHQLCWYIHSYNLTAWEFFTHGLCTLLG